MGRTKKVSNEIPNNIPSLESLTIKDIKANPISKEEIRNAVETKN